MRTTRDRIRHAISFELIGLALITPLGAWAFGMPVADIGVVGVGAATLATVWKYIYNLGFDAAMQRLTGGTRKSIAVRISHAVDPEPTIACRYIPERSIAGDYGRASRDKGFTRE
jgi:uncharacterized membrane protein